MPAPYVDLDLAGNYRDYRKRYPSPFFDLAQFYQPGSIRELFYWCTYYYYNSSLVGSTIRKISRYPITEPIYEDSDEKTREHWRHLFSSIIHIKDRLMEVNLDLNTYGNAYVSIFFPFIRFLVCPDCGSSRDIKSLEWRWSSFRFTYTCPNCGNLVSSDYMKGEVRDVPYRDPSAIRIIRWNPENILVKYNETTGSHFYSYRIPRSLRRSVELGDRDILNETPLLFIEACRRQRLVRMSQNNFRHLKHPTLAEKDMGYGKPLLVNVLKDLYYMFTLRRGQEAIANEHITPFDILYPAANASQDPYVHVDLADWRVQMEKMVDNHRADPNYKGIAPIPVGIGRMGGDGKALLITPELNYLNQVIVGGMGIPQEFLFGNLNWCCDKKTLIPTSKGLLKLNEVCPEEEGALPVEDLHVSSKDGVARVALLHTTGKRTQVRIKTRMGLELNGSPIHRVWVVNPDCSMSWKHLKDVEVGDHVAVPKQTDLWGGIEMSDEEARLLGYMVAEGWCTDKRTGFVNTDPEVIADFSACWEVVFGESVPGATWRDPEDIPGHWGSKRVWSVETRSAEVRSTFVEYGLSSAYSGDKEVPLSVRQAPRKAVMQFLRALFEGDGCCPVEHESSPTVIYSSKSKELVHQIQLLLLNAGIRSCIYPPSGTSACYALMLFGEDAAAFMEEASFVSKRKVEAFNWELPREGFRRRNAKYPYVLENLKALKGLTTGDGAWVTDNTEVNLPLEVYTTAELAAVLGRDVSSVIKYINQGRLVATKPPSVGGRFSTYIVTRDAVQQFLRDGGIRKRAAVGQTTWDINDNNMKHVNWAGVRELDPMLHDRIQDLMDADFFWERVTTIEESSEEVAMCDLTVYDTHSYVAAGIVSHNTGSSITLRSLANDFQHNQTQLMDLTLWMRDKMAVFLGVPKVDSIRFADFRMADDIQRIQQFITLNAQSKISDRTLLTELGLDFDEEMKTILQETEVKNKISETMAKSQAKVSGETMLISYQYQRQVQEMQIDDQVPLQMRQLVANQKLQQLMAAAGIQPAPTPNEQVDENGQPIQDAQYQEGSQGALPAGQDQQLTQAGMSGQPPEQDMTQAGQPMMAMNPTEGMAPMDQQAQVDQLATRWARKLTEYSPGEAMQLMTVIRQKYPTFASVVDQQYRGMQAQTAAAGNFGGPMSNPATAGQVNMDSMDGPGMPRRAGMA